MKVMSCNVRSDNPTADQDNQWKYRRDLCCAYIVDVGADVICGQEFKYKQYVDVAAALPDYDSYGLADEVLNRAPRNAIFWRSARFELISASGYWLSKTPHVPGSKSWDSDCIRLANWVRLADRESGVEFRVINTHLDHVSQLARERQMEMVLEDAAVFPEEYPQILTGDLNVDATNPVIDEIKRAGWSDTHEAVHGPEDPGFTFHRFRGPEAHEETGKIDWVFARGQIVAEDADILREDRDGRFPSDHYFITADLELGG